MKLPVLSILKGTLLSSGVFPDFKSQASPLWVDSENYLFSRNRIQTFLGTTDLFSTGVTESILGVEAVLLDGIRNVVFGTATELGLWDSSTDMVTSEGSGYTAVEDEAPGELADLWDFKSWGDNWIYATNGRDTLQAWKGAGFGDVVDFESEWGSAYIIEKQGVYLVAFALEGELDRAAWCATNNPDVWAATPSNLAGSIFFRELESRIYAAVPFGQISAVFGADTLNALFFNQTSTVFGARRLVKGIGAVGKKAVCNVNGVLYGAGPRGIWRSDGNTYAYIHDPAAKKEIYNNINLEQQSKITAFYDQQLQSVCFLFPVGDETFLRRGWAFSVPDNSWSPFELQATAITTNGVFSFPIISTSVGTVLGQSIYDQGLSSGFEGGTWPLNAPEATVTVGYGFAGYNNGGYGGSLYEGEG